MEHTMLVWAQSVKQLCSKSMEPIIEEFDLTMIEIGIILFLAESPACDTCRDIADNLLLAKSNVSTAVEHLVQKGLVGREPDQADRRKVHLSLRPSARALVRKGQSARDTLLQDGASGTEAAGADPAGLKEAVAPPTPTHSGGNRTKLCQNFV